MVDKGFAIECPHCGKWNEWGTPLERVALRSVEEFEGIIKKISSARRQKDRGHFAHPKLLRCKRPRWSCPASFEAFIFNSEEAALDSLERVPEKWAISRDFRLFKLDKKTRWEGRYYCIMYCSEPVPLPACRL